MDRQPLHVAVSVGIDLRLESRAADERIVRRHGPVVFQPQNFASMNRGVLRACAIVPLADGHVQHPVAAEHELRPEVGAAGVPVVRDEDVAHVRQRFAVEASARQRGGRGPLAGFRVGQVQELVFSEAWMGQHFQQPALSIRKHLRHARNRQRIERAVADDAKASGLFGDEHVAVRQERNAPGRCQPLDDRDDADLRTQRVELLRRVWEGE